MRKFRIKELANGRYSLEVKADSSGDDELWVPASKSEFDSVDAAERGIKRLVAAQCWFYDERGEPCR